MKFDSKEPTRVTIVAKSFSLWPMGLFNGCDPNKSKRPIPTHSTLISTISTLSGIAATEHSTTSKKPFTLRQ